MNLLDEKRARRSGGGPMIELSAMERRERQEQILKAAPRRYGLDAQAIFLVGGPHVGDQPDTVQVQGA